MQIDPVPLIVSGPDAPATALPFQVLMNEGDAIGIFAADNYTTLSGTRVTSDAKLDGGHDSHRDYGAEQGALLRSGQESLSRTFDLERHGHHRSHAPVINSNAVQWAVSGGVQP